MSGAEASLLPVHFWPEDARAGRPERLAAPLEARLAMAPRAPSIQWPVTATGQGETVIRFRAPFGDTLEVASAPGGPAEKRTTFEIDYFTGKEMRVTDFGQDCCRSGANESRAVGIKSAGKGFAGARDRAAFCPRDPPSVEKDNSTGARKPDSRRTAWWR
jgi:hypothetical protein